MTFCIVTCLCLALFAGVHANILDEKIVGGSDTTIEQFPFQVSLRIQDKHFCGGSIISQKHILTAAHCLYSIDPSNITVVTGSSSPSGSKGRAYRISSANVHPNYTDSIEDSYRNDIGIITLSSRIQFDRTTNKINLPSKDVQVGHVLTISGWGYQNVTRPIAAPVLQKVSTTVISKPSCEENLSRVGIGKVNDEQICALQKEGVGTCNGDSGGPVSIKNEVMGVVSFGIPCGAGYPDVFTRVFSYKSWIQSIIGSS